VCVSSCVCEDERLAICRRKSEKKASSPSFFPPVPLRGQRGLGARPGRRDGCVPLVPAGGGGDHCLERKRERGKRLALFKCGEIFRDRARESRSQINAANRGPAREVGEIVQVQAPVRGYPTSEEEGGGDRGSPRSRNQECQPDPPVRIGWRTPYTRPKSRACAVNPPSETSPPRYIFIALPASFDVYRLFTLHTQVEFLQPAFAQECRR